ncbi:hypothetical protein ACL6C3_06685 [Capilliphycus salinus ALCB114379]|uniref:hypothetical protein n=1 Tax=Capilliphycus salinus TaxID=2768948 RepID=UPI0039A72372
MLILLSHPEVKSITLITSRECLKESKVRVADAYYGLPGLEKTEWQEFFNYYQIKTDSPAFHKLYEAYGGNTKAMEILCGAILRPPFNGNLDAYYQENKEDLLIEGELEDLVASQFEHLSKNDEEAYKLLCRLGIYSYQNTDFLPLIALNVVLWDVPKHRVKRVIKYLQDCFLIKTQTQEIIKDNFYQIFEIHPVILSEALSRLYSCTSNIGDIVFLMKQEIDSFVENNTEIQTILKRVSKKSDLIFKQINIRYKKGSIRSFYLSQYFEFFTSSSFGTNGRYLVLSRIIDGCFPGIIGVSFGSRNVPKEIRLDNYLLICLLYFLKILSLIQESDEIKSHTFINSSALFSECLYESLGYTSNIIFKIMSHKIISEINSKLKDIKILKEWWIETGINMVKELQ